MNYVLVTGASSGLGKQICRCLLELGYGVFAGVRTPGDARMLSEECGSGLVPVIMDVTDEQSVASAKSNVMEILSVEVHTLVAIINNAGIVVSGASLYIPIAQWQLQFDVNFFGVIRVTNAFFPLLVPKETDDRHPRRIINMSSVSGLFASPFMGPYSASKYALEAWSDSLRRELYMHDIQVVILEPGNFRTPIWDKAKQQTPWLGPEYQHVLSFKDKIIDRNIANGLPPSALDPIIRIVIQSHRVKARYLIRPQKWKFQMIRLLPVSWVDRMIRKRLKAGANVRPF